MIIYKTTNLLNGKIYIGQDFRNNPKYLGSGIYICKSIKKFGRENFKKEILCECFSKEELDKKEKYWIKKLNSKVPNGYNLTDGGEGFSHGDLNPAKRPEVREKHRGPRSDEFKRKCKIAQNRPEVLEKHRKPRGPMSEEQKIKLRKPRSEETKLKMRKPHSEEHKLNTKLAMNRPEFLEKTRKPHSEERKLNAKLAMNRPEVKKKLKKPKSEIGRKNIKLGQQKRRENEKKNRGGI